MTSLQIAGLVFASLFGSALLGMLLRKALPQNHLGADAKDTIKLAMGLVATMTALVLGLLVASAKSSYDTQRSEVIQMAAKIAFLNRPLTVYGPEAAGARDQLRRSVFLILELDRPFSGLIEISSDPLRHAMETAERRP